MNRLNAWLIKADDWFDKFLGSLWPILAILALVAFVCTIARYP